MKRRSYPGDPVVAKVLCEYIAVVAGTPLPRRVREPERFVKRIQGARP